MLDQIPLHTSPTLRAIVKRVREIAEEDLPVLLIGETGTGKSYLAGVIHTVLEKTDGMFLTLDCATLNPNLVESELFGHEKGAFTGAADRKSGMFEFACGGTILLDEVENLSLEIQAKLLRVLDEKKFRRVGGIEEMAAYFQLISTINVDVDEILQTGQLRKDFFYRIASVEIVLPPLRKRPQDILIFADYFLRLVNEKYGREFRLTQDVRNYLLNYPWPGNIRELKHAFFAASRSARSSELRIEDFEAILRKPKRRVATKQLQTLAEAEKDHIQTVLKHTGFKIARSARILGIAENTLRAKMRKYRIKKPNR
ncbi:sigma-54-dependent Fis family transcriptional regulator [candidate division KSB1 bacterium]|nr:sigma-54-dependent Fis family transcriptional regulator [candidate division KSB1 bacterium]NIR72005.1 sigma-54-dependent Fis family transcriptional regulator [candidate division KSB1 bacterium]NIS24998.1 sigma-54-dependent Fis family transcriptional regulator [candidate division KSB1 bacterium]NIT71914.1 sigma-54-dependent Fis family transcriptional regulator [candidate division KSB1 bacterium]NIU25653.1 sigma-54-dependent Fis family transcriptional regulator [candidate division KSB1 bacteri